MANTRELRRRIKSVKNTAQITKAMQMVAATKMKRAQNQALNGRPYSFNLSEALQRLLPMLDITAHPLLLGNDTKTTGVILLTTDKSLCGALNTNLFRLITASGLLSSGSIFYTVGKKGRNFVAKTGSQLAADFENLDTITFRQAVQLSKLIMDSFLAKEIGQAVVIYPRFGSTLRQEATQVKLLPVEYSELESVILGSATCPESDSGQVRMPQSDNRMTRHKGIEKEFLFEPDPSQLLNYILVHFLQTKIYQSLLETKASEHSARMIAMQNATDNALEIVDDLNLTYNQTRQDAITRELLEITSAAAAMQ